MQIMYNILSTHLNQLFYDSFPVIVIKMLIFTLQIGRIAFG